MEILTSKAGTLALRFTGKLVHEDVSKSYELIEEALESHERVHLLAEVDGLSGFEAEAITQDLSRGLRLLGKLNRFGRVAVVSDQPWVRWLARAESAILPGISYRTYDLSEREQALAWVEGRAELPYGLSLSIIRTDRPDVIGIEVNGRISREEMTRVSRELNAVRDAGGIKSVVVRIKEFRGFDPSMAFDAEYLQMKFGFLRELDRYAVVGGPKWIQQWVDFIGPLVRIETRTFAAEAEAAAWEWLGAQPATRATLAA